MERHFPEFSEERTTSRGVPKFSKMSYRECLVLLDFLGTLYNEECNYSIGLGLGPVSIVKNRGIVFQGKPNNVLFSVVIGVSPRSPLIASFETRLA